MNTNSNYKLLNLTLFLEVICLISCLVTLSLKATSMLQNSLYAETTGIEGPPLYGIYKIWNRDILYQPLTENPSIMIYNFLFYLLYGFSAKLFICEQNELPSFLRILTLFFTFCTILIISLYFYLEFNKQIKEKTIIQPKIILVLLPATFALGPYIEWWHLTARPDILAIMFEVIGLILYLKSQGSRKASWIILITLVFWLAWATKQSNISLWIGLIIYWVFNKNFKNASISIIIFFILSGLVFLILDKNYFEHTILSNILCKLSFPTIQLLHKGLHLGLYLYFPLLIVILKYIIKNKLTKIEWSLFCLIIFALLFASLYVLKYGSAKNHFLTLYFVAYIFLGILYLNSLQTNDKTLQNFLLINFSLSFFVSLCINLCNFTLPAKRAVIQIIAPHTKLQAIELKTKLQKAKRPIFIEKEYYALPWFSGNDPAEIIDPIAYFNLLEKSLIISIPEKIASGKYSEIFASSERMKRIAESSNYVKIADYGEITHFALINSH